MRVTPFENERLIILDKQFLFGVRSSLFALFVLILQCKSWIKEFQLDYINVYHFHGGCDKRQPLMVNINCTRVIKKTTLLFDSFRFQSGSSMQCGLWLLFCYFKFIVGFLYYFEKNMNISVGKQKPRARYCVYAYFATEMKLKSAFHFSKMVHTFILFFSPNNEHEMKKKI